MYIKRIIDQYLEEWTKRADHKPILLRGARQVGKSSSVRHLGRLFQNFVEINFEKNEIYKQVFEADLDAHRIVNQLSAVSGKKIIAGKTLLFLF